MTADLTPEPTRNKPTITKTSLPAPFKKYVKDLFYQHQCMDNGKEVYCKLISNLNLWRATKDPEHAIPGYKKPPANYPTKSFPQGWSQQNILRLRPKIGLHKKWELIFTKDHNVKVSEEKEGVWCAHKEEIKPQLFAFASTPREALELLAEKLSYPTLKQAPRKSN